MSEYVPDPWHFILLSLALFRAIKLIGDDTILDRPRDWLSDRLGDKFDELVTCPWCLGSWLGGAIWIAWIVWPEETLAVSAFAAFLAVAALVFSVWNAISEPHPS